MKTKLSKIIFIILPIFLSVFFTPTIALAANNNTTGSSGTAEGTDVCSNNYVSAKVQAAAGCGGASDDIVSIITNILKVIIGVCGLVAVVYIIIGGINYMTSTGDPSKTKKAKDTILYALIGLIICALAFAIVNWGIDIIK